MSSFRLPGPLDTEYFKAHRNGGGKKAGNNLIKFYKLAYFYSIQAADEKNYSKNSMDDASLSLAPPYWFYILNFSCLLGERVVLSCSSLILAISVLVIFITWVPRGLTTGKDPLRTRTNLLYFSRLTGELTSTGVFPNLMFPELARQPCDPLSLFVTS